MNLTSKQRAYLGSEASTMNAIFQIGKASLTPELINGLDEALEKRELIKISVLKNCADDPREIARRTYTFCRCESDWQKNHSFPSGKKEFKIRITCKINFKTL